uniref:Uncharacterized protein n=1 Tax=uncultured marine group II/III euryarchaeote KM3_99_A09 TaxID=1456549 RepID=A0A075I3B2_9EURY|nr:hypothetical protein [uncultured marine group II/III euryarchaeote KM3_99_A09]
MTQRRALQRDEAAAATELGYVFTFLLGLTFLSFFSVWAFGMQDARGDTWTEQAMTVNLDAVAAAVERADEASRLDGNATYAEPVTLLLSTAENLGIRMVLDDDGLLMQDRGATVTASRSISAAGSTTHSGEVELAGVETVWVLLQGNTITLSTSQPGV